MFNAIGEEAENPGGRSRRISLMNVGVDLGTEQEKRTDSLCIFDAVFSGDVFKVGLYSFGTCRVTGLPKMGCMFSLSNGLGFALKVQCKRRRTSQM